VFVDNNSSGHVDSGDTVLKVAKALSASTVTLTATGFSGSGYVQYSGTGTSANGAGAFTVCSKGVAGRQVSISTTGRVSTVSGVACP
jgi:Tfp pilus assembly protein FimT